MSSPTLADLLQELARRFPAIGETCVEGQQLSRSYVANLDGQRFVALPDCPLSDGNTVLILSADAGG